MGELVKASSWSFVTEVVSKVISPLSFLVLTKILSPEDFGVVAVATTFISFLQIITDLGVSKVIIQNFNEDSTYRKLLNNTCFWFNLALGIVTFILVIFFSEQIASFFGNVSATSVVQVMSAQIIFYSLSSVQNANFRKELNFKFLFFTRLITIAMPIIVAIPLAFLGGGYWAIVIATVLGSFLNTIVLWMYSKWKPTLCFDFTIIKSILNKSIWSSFDEVIVWIPIGLDAYLIGNYLSARDLGIYSLSRTLFFAAIAITLGAILPVLYSHLSRIQNNEEEFNRTINYSQRIMYTLAGTMGVSVFLYADLIEILFFNNNWEGISKVLGIFFLIMSNSYFYSVLQEALRSKGYFKDLFKVKFFSMFLIIPLLFLAINSKDIYVYTIVRGLSLYIWIFGIFYYSKKRLNISFITFIRNSKYFLIIMIVTISISLLIDHFSSFFSMNIFIIKTFIFIIMLLMIFYLNRDLLRKINCNFINRSEK